MTGEVPKTQSCTAYKTGSVAAVGVSLLNYPVAHLSSEVRGAQAQLLRNKHLLGGQLEAESASAEHDAVCGGDDVLASRCRIRGADLRHHPHVLHTYSARMGLAP